MIVKQFLQSSTFLPLISLRSVFREFPLPPLASPWEFCSYSLQLERPFLLAIVSMRLQRILNILQDMQLE